MGQQDCEGGERMRRIGLLVNLAANDPMGQARVAAFVQGLQAAGWSDGRNVRIDTRWAAADPGNYRKYAAELIALGTRRRPGQHHGGGGARSKRAIRSPRRRVFRADSLTY